MQHRDIPPAHVIIPSEQVPFRRPALIVNGISGRKEGKFLPDRAHGLSVQHDLKGRQKAEQLLVDGPHLPARGLFVHMDLMAQREPLGLYKILGPAGLIVDVIAVRPGKDPLANEQLHKHPLPFHYSGFQEKSKSATASRSQSV